MPNARADLTAIGDWIARDDPRRAVSFIDELLVKAENLAEGALLYPEVNRRKRPGVRRLNHRDYRILYDIKGDVVRILHVHHGRRRYP